MHTTRLTLGTSIVLVLIAGCGTVDGSDRCEHGLDCDAGQVCSAEGRCLDVGFFGPAGESLGGSPSSGGLPGSGEAAERPRAERLAGYVVEKVADTATPIPEGEGTFTTLGNPSIRGGTVAFLAWGPDRQQGVYSWSDGTLTKVADIGTPAPGGTGIFTYISTVDGDLSVASDGSIAFRASATNRNGIYTNRTGPLSVVADTTMSIPGSPGVEFGYFWDVSHDAGNVAFMAGHGLYLHDGSTISLIAEEGMPKPGGTGTIGYFYGPPSMSGADIVFLASDGRQFTVYGWIGGELTIVADSTTPVTNSARPLSPNFTSPVIRDGVIAFQNLGIYVDRGSGFEMVAGLKTRMPGTIVWFNAFGPPALDAGKVTFGGRTYFSWLNGSFLFKFGLFTDLRAPLRRVAPEVARQSSLDGKVVRNVLSGTEAASDGRFAFRALFAEGEEGIYVARPE